MNTILIAAFVAMGFMLPVLFCAGFYYGFCTAEGVFTQQTVKTENIPGKFSAGKPAPVPPETREERLARILAENVENFGTDIPQKEVV